MTERVLDQIHQVLLERLAQHHAKLEGSTKEVEDSYVVSLYDKGLDAILKKIGEEATETVMAAKDGVAEKIVYEIADLWFHTLVLLAQQGLEPDMVLDELARRVGQSGIAEKASRRN
jgi:phosphoribosyl-ATP pyrophosphohydrolase